MPGGAPRRPRGWGVEDSGTGCGTGIHGWFCDDAGDEFQGDAEKEKTLRRGWDWEVVELGELGDG